MVKAENNHHRETIIKYNLLQYIDYTNTIPRNKEIIKEHIKGESMSFLGKKYGLSRKTVSSMIASYVNKVSRYCAKNGIDYRKETQN